MQGLASHRGNFWRALSLSLLVAVVTSCAPAGERGTRIVLVTLDTLRYDSFAGSAHRPSSMPLTRARAKQCLVFEQFYSATSSTQPSHATLLTDRHPWQHGVSRNGLTLGEEQLTVAEMLQKGGFETAAVVASFPLHHRFGFAQGFGEYHDNFFQPLGEGKTWEGNNVPLDGQFYSLAETVTDLAIDILDRHANGSRQFLWVHYFDPHEPYGDSVGETTLFSHLVLHRVLEEGANRDEEIRHARQLYDEDVAYLDRSLDRLFRRLSEDEAAFETHVLVTADHGESFGEDDSMGHGSRLTPGQIHVPFFLCSPRIRPGVRRDVAGSIDVTPTVLALADVSRSGSIGRDLTQVAAESTRSMGMRRTFASGAEEHRLDGRTYPLDEPLFYTVEGDGALYVGNASGLVPPTTGEPPPADLRKKLIGSFTAFETELASKNPTELVDPGTRRGLRALGYVQ